MATKLVARSEDFNEWFNTVVLTADMADYGPVRGTMIIKPYGWALWENMQAALDQRFKATGHLNAGFPMFLPYSFLEREAKHVAGFSPELALVTHVGGEKSALERFAGADRTFTIEAMMGDGRALQSGTSHNLGQNFAKAFNIEFVDQNNEMQHCWTTSWGPSSRFIGAIIMVHGDDNGLIMPPRLAPYQTVIVPIYKNDDEKSKVLAAVERINKALIAAGVRTKVDLRDHLTPGFKFNDWELRGVPVRMEIGPRDVDQNVVVLARRDLPGKPGKQVVSQDELVPTLQTLLETIQAALLARATKFRDDNMHEAKNYAEFKEMVAKGFVRAWWAGSDADEQQVKAETKASHRCYPLEQPGGKGICFYTGQPATQMAIFARAY